MICSIIKRRLQKVPLSQDYKQEFLDSLQEVQQKYQSQTLNKSLMIKKICKKYLKICNNLINETNVDQSLAALEFVKLLQLDIYEGKSYELYPIKITSHLLFVKCFDLKISQKNGSPQSEDLKRKKHVYVQRLKMFVQQIEESFFYEFLQKDYYSNLELILFLILKNQIEKVLENNVTYVTTTQSILIELSFVKNYVIKLFELLKCHIIQLNEMLFYLENKVYQLLTVKVKLLIQLFHIETVINFIEHIGQNFSDKEWLFYKKFLQNTHPHDDNHEAKPQTTKNDPKDTSYGKHTSQNPQPTFKNLAKRLLSEEKTFTEPEGGNYQNFSYEAIKAKFSSEEIDAIWGKYETILSKIPNSIDKEQIFEQQYTIINSFKEKPEDKQKKSGTHKSIRKKTDNQNSDEDSSEDECDEIKSDQDDNQRDDKLKNRRGQRNNSVYKERRNSQLNDFKSFVKESSHRQVYFSHFKPNESSLNSVAKVESKQIEGDQNQNISSKSTINNWEIKQNIQSLQQQPSDLKANVQQKTESKVQQQIIQKTNGNESAKRSNFKLIKDMKNIFEFINEKNQKHKSLQNLLRVPTKEKVEFKSLLKNSKVSLNNLSQNLTSEGLRKLNAVKNPTLKILENIKENEFERLRRIKSTDILETKNKTSKTIGSRNSSKEKSEKGRSSTLYFPFLNYASKQNDSKARTLKTFEMPKKSLPIICKPTGKDKLYEKKEPLRIKNRSSSKKTTLDIIEGERLSEKMNKLKLKELSRDRDLMKESNDIIEEDSEGSMNEQKGPKTYISMEKQRAQNQKVAEVPMKKTSSLPG